MLTQPPLPPTLTKPPCPPPTPRLTQQIKADCALLEQCQVMDYSLLLGVHYRSGPLATSRRSMDGQVANFEEHNAAGDLEAEVERIQVCVWRCVCGGGAARVRESVSSAADHLLPGVLVRGGMVADVMLGMAQRCSCVKGHACASPALCRAAAPAHHSTARSLAYMGTTAATRAATSACPVPDQTITAPCPLPQTRVQEMKLSDDLQQDLLDLARLKILGSGSKGRVLRSPTLVLAMRPKRSDTLRPMAHSEVRRSCWHQGCARCCVHPLSLAACRL